MPGKAERIMLRASELRSGAGPRLTVETEWPNRGEKRDKRKRAAHARFSRAQAPKGYFAAKAWRAINHFRANGVLDDDLPATLKARAEGVR